MASAFEGPAQNVPEGKYATSANEMPKFMQDAIYNQIQLAQNIAQTPYQEYNLPLVAEATPDQQQAWANIRASQGSWQPGMEYAQQGMAALAQGPGQAAAAQPYFQQVAGMSGMQSAQPALQQQANLLGGINYSAPTGTLDARQSQYLSPELSNYALQQAQDAYGLVGGIDIAGAASPYIQRAAGMSGLENAQGLMQQQAGLLGSLNYNAPTSNLSSAQNAYLNRDLANAQLQAGQTSYQQAATQNIAAAADPYLMQQLGALSGLNYNAATSNLSAAQNPYLSPTLAQEQLAAGKLGLQKAAAIDVTNAADPYLAKQMGVLNALNYNAPASDLGAAQSQYLSPKLAQEQLAASNLGLQKAAGIDIAKSAQPYLSQQVGMLNALNYNAPTTALTTAQNKYLAPDVAKQELTAGVSDLQKASGIDITKSAQPYLSQQVNMLNALNYNAPTTELTSAQNKYLAPDVAKQQLASGVSDLQKAAGIDITKSAQPYLQQAAKKSVTGIEQYMNPYQEGVMNAIAQQGARNLSENLLPAVSDAFIRAGQFGGSRMGTFGERALRDTQESILNQQSQAIQQGYGQALAASQADLARQAQLASTAGQLTEQQQAALLNIGQAKSNIGQAQQQAGLSAAQQAASTRQQALAQAQQAAAQLGQVGAQQGQLTAQQQAALLNVGQAKTSVGQAQQQAGLQAAQQAANTQQQALAQAQQAAAQLGQVGAQQGQLTAQQQAALLNTSQAQAAAGQAQQQAGLQAAQQLAAAKEQAISQAQQSAAQMGQIAAERGQLSGQQQAALTNISQAQTAAGQAQQQVGLSAAQQVANAQQQAIAQAQQGASQIGQVGLQRGQLTAQQLQALTNLGQAQTAAGQAQQQAGLTAAQQVANAQQQALAQAQAGAAQYGQLAGQVGSLTAQQQQLLASLGQTAGQLTGQQASNLLNLGQAQAQFGQAQQQAGLQAAQTLSGAQQQAIAQQLQGAGQYGQLGGALGALTADQQRILAGLGTSAAGFAGGDINTQMSALSNLASLAQAQQGMSSRDAAALEAIGQTQQGNMQQQLSAAYQQQQQQQLYQQQMADWLSTQIRGMAPITPQQTTTSQVGNTVQYGPSPLSQIAGAYATYKGLTG